MYEARSGSVVGGDGGDGGEGEGPVPRLRRRWMYDDIMVPHADGALTSGSAPCWSVSATTAAVVVVFVLTEQRQTRVHHASSQSTLGREAARFSHLAMHDDRQRLVSTVQAFPWHVSVVVTRHPSVS